MDVRTQLQDAAFLNTRLPANIRIQRKLSEGGQGIVYEGIANGAEAAVKIYFPGQNSTRIDREVAAMRALRCDTIVQVLWSGDVEIEGERLPVVATKLIPGTPFDKALQTGALTEDQIWPLVHDVSEAISHLWGLRIVHRDLKPSNIILLPTGRACVIDLGLARHLEKSSLTAMGMTWGTLGYLSPEQTRSVRQLTCKSDIFALAVIAVEALNGRHPTNGDQLRLLASGFHSALPGRAQLSRHAELVRAMLSVRPSARPAPENVCLALSAFARR